MTAPIPPPTTPRLSKPQFAIILTAVVVFFLVGRGPVWKDPFNYYKLAGSIIWSYVPIPFLVLAFLAASRKLRFSSWLVDTAILTVTKFGVTGTIMIAIWAMSGPPTHGAGFRHNRLRRPPLPEFLAAPKAEPLPPVTPAAAGGVTGRVIDATGAPVGGVLVWLEDVLPRDFPTRADPVVLSNDGSGPQPRIAAVQAGEKLILRSLDGRLHTLMGELPDGTMAFNHPMLVLDRERPLALQHAFGEVDVRCTAHESEAHARLVVLAHPFFATTGSDGTFSFSGVPAGPVTVVAEAKIRRAGRLPAHGVLRVDLVLVSDGN